MGRSIIFSLHRDSASTRIKFSTIEILSQHVFPMHNRIGRGFLLMQENAHPHTAQNIRRFLRLNDITTH